MRKNHILTLLCVLCLGFTSCEEYEDYIKDYEFSAVYFATQQPLRTIVAYDEMQFKVGVALGGKRENKQAEWASYSIDPTLLAGTGFTLLPKEYYTVSDLVRMVIPEGEFIGAVTVTLDKDAFTSDPLAHLNTYALPLRLQETSVDSILSGRYDAQGNQLVAPKDYTVLVVKYISPLHGTYYHKGVQQELSAQGEVVNETVYNVADLSRNKTWDLSTQALNVVTTSGVGAFTKSGLKLTRQADNTVTIEKAAGSTITLLEGAGTYDPATKTFTLTYKFNEGGKTYSVTDTLIQRQAPEKDLRFEEWK